MIKSESMPSFSECLNNENNAGIMTPLLSAEPTRRTLMNMMVSTAIVGTALAVPTTTNAVTQKPSADALLIDLANQYIVAEQRYCDLHWQVEEMGEHRGEPPEALRILSSDADLGRTPWKENDEFWTRPCDIQKWQKLDEWLPLKNAKTDDRLELVMERKPPSPELRARAEQIVTAYDQWQAAGERPSGYESATREMDEAEALYRQIEETIAETRAKTVEGLLAKVRCAQAYMKTEGVIDGIDQGGAAETMALSIFEDIQALVAGGPSN